ncbi:MAG: hypothetical protein Q8896_09770 [Bacteroidota bacterium]|nr:hypothetical protein [Bacteroidota bacterium]
MPFIISILFSLLLIWHHAGAPHCSFSSPDTVLSGIIIQDRESSEKIIGTEYQLDRNERLHYLSTDGREKLTLQFHPGDTKNEFAEFDVSLPRPNTRLKRLPIEHFSTNNSIELGRSDSSVIEKLGTCFTRSMRKGVEVIRYEINDVEHSGFLQRYNMPLYYGEYFFKNHVLIRFRFGFEYP